MYVEKIETLRHDFCSKYRSDLYEELASDGKNDNFSYNFDANLIKGVRRFDGIFIIPFKKVSGRAKWPLESRVFFYNPNIIAIQIFFTWERSGCFDKLPRETLASTR